MKNPGWVSGSRRPPDRLPGHLRSGSLVAPIGGLGGPRDQQRGARLRASRGRRPVDLAGRRGRQGPLKAVVLFLHKPLWWPLPGPDDDPLRDLAVDDGAARRVLSLFAPGQLRAVASGHLHRFSVRPRSGLVEVAPSTAFLAGVGATVPSPKGSSASGWSSSTAPTAPSPIWSGCPAWTSTSWSTWPKRWPRGTGWPVSRAERAVARCSARLHQLDPGPVRVGRKENLDAVGLGVGRVLDGAPERHQRGGDPVHVPDVEREVGEADLVAAL